MNNARKGVTKKPVRSKELRVIDFMIESLFIARLKSRDWESVLDEMVECLVASGKAKDKDILLQMLKQRENLGSTGIGKGVAVPHGRSLSISDLTVVFARSREGVDFKAIDGKAVHLFFLVVAPPHDTGARYLPLLGKIVEVVKDHKNRKRLLDGSDFLEVRNIFQEGEKR